MNYTTNHNNMYNGLTWTGEFHHGIDPPEITIMVSEPIIDTLNRYQVVYLNGYELPVFEAEYNAKLSNPSLMPTYIAEDYEYFYYSYKGSAVFNSLDFNQKVYVPLSQGAASIEVFILVYDVQPMLDTLKDLNLPMQLNYFMINECTLLAINAQR